MDVINRFLQESLHPTLFHVSHLQDLKVLKPRLGSTHDGKNLKRIYACSDKTYVSAFGWDWNDSMATLGRINSEPWQFKVSKKYLPQMKKPCSMYTISRDGFTPIRRGHQEYVSEAGAIYVISEVKYKTALECMQKNGLKIVWSD